MAVRKIKKWPDNFEELYKKFGQHQHGIRLLALWKLQHGAQIKDVCKLLGKTHRTIYQWEKFYETGGIKSLLGQRPSRGPKAGITDAKTLENDLKFLQAQHTGKRIRYNDITQMINAKYKLNYSSAGVYSLLKKLGLSGIVAKSKPRKHNTAPANALTN